MVSSENGKVRSREGAAPVMKEKLNWIFLNKSKKGWKPIPDQSPPVEQFVGFGTSLTNEQFELLAAEVSE